MVKWSGERFLELVQEINSGKGYALEGVLPSEEYPHYDISGAPAVWVAESVFDGCSEAECREVLEAFISGELPCGTELGGELAKLLAKRGHCVAELVEPLIAGRDWSSFENDFFLLGYLACMSGGDVAVCRLVEVVPEDFRDGLFVAALAMDSERVDDCLANKFLEWNRDRLWTPTATGELGWLGAFLKKWLRVYGCHGPRVQELVKVYFECL